MKFITPLMCAMILMLTTASIVDAAELTPTEQLGKSIFFDTNLSINATMACAACHDPAAGWTGPTESINDSGAAYEGAISGRFGNRKPPSSAYATLSPILHFEVEEKKEVLFEGGNFWNGRATGEKLGNPAADQAQGPFLNPVEQAAPDNACIVYKVCTATYSVPFVQVWGDDTCYITWPSDVDTVCMTEGAMVNLLDDDRDQVARNYDYIALSIADFEASPESNAFSSKYDAYLAGLVDLSKEEKKGLHMFKGKGKCANCHLLDSDDDDGELPLFTDFTYDNLGVPRNPENPWYTQTKFNPLGEHWIDMGLGGFLDTRIDYQQYAAANLGKQKVPTLRNVDKRPSQDFVKAYAHNGYFKSLKSIVHFYNTRDAKPSCESQGINNATEAMALTNDCWPEPEVSMNVNTKELGNLHLTEAQEDALVAFLKTLTDGYMVLAP